MGLEEIKLKILNDSRDAASEILDKAHLKTRQIVAEAENNAELKAENILKLGDKKAKEEKKRILTLARLESKSLILFGKQELIENIFKEAFNRLNNLSDTEYRNFIKKFMLKTILSGEEEVIVSPAPEGDTIESLIPEINSELVKENRSGRLKLFSERREIGRGFILKDINTEINCTFGSIVEEVKNETESEVAKILFD
jgi:V/A-type H+-transporting ATPase subunit E